jgi:hypothetical protein
MTTLAAISGAAAVAHAALGAWMFGAPGQVRRQCTRGPRSRILGGALAALVVGWAAWNIHQGDLGAFNVHKRHLPLAAAAVWGALFWTVPELLAARMCGALLMLAANPALRAARLNDDPATWILSAAAYAWVGAGMALMLGPWRLRRGAEAALATPLRARAAGAALLALGAALFVLAARVA